MSSSILRSTQVVRGAKRCTCAWMAKKNEKDSELYKNEHVGVSNSKKPSNTFRWHSNKGPWTTTIGALD